ncbi:MAG: hypothetical protein PHE68_01015, partial [Candidatus Peribacteraceae bacterium]|nr:hypothetical protein [Candidatus Peribacteraceae bacterium]
MRPSRPFLVLSLLPLFLISCGSPTSTTDPAGGSSSSSSSETSVAETHNVVYSGRVRTAGISIYMEGTHRLELPDGRFILLESTMVDLNGYVGELAEVSGTVRPTVEAGGMIMRVEQIRLLEGSSSSESTSESSSSPSSEASSSSYSFSFSLSSVSSVTPVSSTSSITVVPASSATSSVPSKTSAPSSKSSAGIVTSSVSASPDLSARIAPMAKQNM